MSTVMPCGLAERGNMALIGYTNGGSPIFFNGTKSSQPSKVRSGGRPRYRCRCGQRNTARQVKAKGGHCPHCGAEQIGPR